MQSAAFEMTMARSRPLLVFVPDSTGRRESVQKLVDFSIQEPFADAHEPLICDFPMHWLSNRDLSQVSKGIAADINAFYTANAGTVSKIILCGYSLGAMLVRRAFLDANGLGYPAGQRRRRANAVERIRSHWRRSAVDSTSADSRLRIAWRYGSQRALAAPRRCAARSSANRGPAMCVSTRSPTGEIAKPAPV